MNRDKHPHAAGQTLGIANDPVVTLTPAPTPVPKTVSEMRDEARRCLETAKTTAEPEVRTRPSAPMRARGARGLPARSLASIKYGRQASGRVGWSGRCATAACPAGYRRS
jgi:hypothetical protein